MTDRAGDLLVHAGSDGAACAVHAPATLPAVMDLASIGARMSAFNHDIASKLQGLMMALDELDELIEGKGDEDLRRALGSAHAAMKELNALLTANRALTRGSKPARTTLRELVRQAAERSGMMLDGEIVGAGIECSIPATAHAISLVMDVCAGVQRLRSLQVSSCEVDGFAEVAFTINGAAPPTTNERLALAAYGVARERGTLHCETHCDPPRIAIRLPIV